MSISGKLGGGKIDGVVIAGVQDWEAVETIDQLDGTTGSDGGYENDDGGVRRVEVTMNLVQDISTGVYSAVSAGTEITNLQLFRDLADVSPAFAIPTFRVYESGNRVEVRGRSTVRVRGRSAGSYTRNDPA